MRNNNGSFTYSSILKFNDEVEGQLTIFPSPASSTINASFIAGSGQLYKATIFDARGHLVRRVDYVCSSGRMQISVDVRSLANGAYVLVIENENGLVGRAKFVKN